MRARYVMLFFSSLLILAACDSEETGYEDWSFLAADKSGVLGEPPISGMAYRTSIIHGVTDEKGQFSYRGGEQINFSIGDIDLPRVTAKPLIRLVDFGGGQENQVVRNIRRLLWTLDTDGNPANGVTIDAIARERAKSAQVDFNMPTDAAFEANVANYLARVKPDNPVLVTLDAAPPAGGDATPVAPVQGEGDGAHRGAVDPPAPVAPAESTSGTPAALEPPRRLAIDGPAIDVNIDSEDGAGYVFAAKAGKTYTITVTPKTPTDDPDVFVFRNLTDMRNFWSVEEASGVDSPEAAALRVGMSANEAGMTEMVSFTADHGGDYFIMIVDTSKRGNATVAVAEQ